jgi:phage terminase large subunit-like protein
MTDSIPAALGRCSPSVRAQIIASLPPRSLRLLNRHFAEWAHIGQLQPPGEWRTWVLMAGRGFGKTRAGTEWVLSCVRDPARWSPLAAVTRPPGGGRGSESERIAGSPLSRLGSAEAPSPLKGRGAVRIALVAASLDEARRVMVEGPSGILAVARPGEVREWSFARRRILFASGAEATLFSGAHPDGLRGPEHDFAWCDELAKWRYPRETWDNLQLGLRRGAHPRALATTTPRRGAALDALLGEDGVVQTGGPSATNPHLPDGWVAAQAARIGSALLKRQELDGELLTDVSGALWPRALIESCRVSILPASPPAYAGGAGGGSSFMHNSQEPPPPAPPRNRGGEDFMRIIVGVDPPASAMGDACGIVVCGLGADGIGYVLADCSAGGLSPEGWARKVAGAAAAWDAGLAVAEANNGGDMIRSVLRAAAPDLPVKLVHARDAKVARAAAVAALFEGGRARFAGTFPALEDELAGLSYDQPYAGPGRSPDRADAMVWALDALMPRGAGPAVRSV